MWNKRRDYIPPSGAERPSCALTPRKRRQDRRTSMKESCRVKATVFSAVSRCRRRHCRFLRTMRLHFYSCSRHKRLIQFFRHPISKSSSKDTVRPRVDGRSLSHRRKNSLIKTNAVGPQSPYRSQQLACQRRARHVRMLALRQPREPRAGCRRIARGGHRRFAHHPA